MSEQPSPKALWPVAIAFALLMLVMTLAFDQVLERRRNPNLSLVTDHATPGRVVLKRNRDGAYLAPGEINGHRVTLLVDTGATIVAVPEAAADRLGLTRGPGLSVETAGGRTRAFQTFIDSITIGGIRVENVPGVITPAMRGDDVLLGMTFLRHVDFRQQGDQLVIEASADPR